MSADEKKNLRDGSDIFDSMAETLMHMIAPFGMGCVVIPVAISTAPGSGIVSEMVEEGCHVEVMAAKCSMISADGKMVGEKKQRLAYARLLRRVADIWTREK